MKGIRVVLLVNAVALVAAVCGIASPGLADTQSDQSYYNAGVAYQEKGEWENALASFHSMATRGSLAGDVSLRCAECYVKVNMPRAAIAELRAGLSDIGTDTASSRLVIAKLEEYAARCTRLGSKRYDYLIEAYQRIARLDSENAPKYAQAIIDCYLGKGDWDGATAACDFVINNYPGTKAAKFATLKKGSAWEGRGDLASAINAYLACGRQSSDMIGEAALKASDCYEKNKDLSGSVKMLKLCIASGATDAKLAEMYERLGDECLLLDAGAAGEAAFAKGLDVPEKDRDVTTRIADKLAGYYLNAGGRDKAGSVYAKLIAKYPDRELFYRKQLSRALISYDLNASDQISLESVRNAGSVGDAGNAAVWHADDLMAYGKGEAAVNFITQAVAERPEIAKQAIPARAVIRNKCRIGLADIVSDYAQLISLYPDCESVPEWKLAKAEAQLMWLNDPESAKKTLNEILASYPKWSRIIAVKHDLGMAYRAAGDYKTALAMFDEALTCPEFGNYRALVLAQQASCYRDLGQKTDESSAVGTMSDAYPDDCWTALEESRQSAATASGQ